MKKKIVIYGAGGQGRVTADIILNEGKIKLIGFVDHQTRLIGKKIFGYPVLGTSEVLPQLFKKGIKHCFIAIGDNRTRMEIAKKVEKLGFKLYTAIHPKATIAKSAVIGKGTAVMAGAVINPGAKIGNNVIINTNAVIEHDNVIEDEVHIASGVLLAGHVNVKKLAFVGMGARIKEYLGIGTGSMVGMGAVVINNVPDNVLVVGIPAKIKKYYKKN